MASIRDVEFEDIKTLLINNDIAVPRHEKPDRFYKLAEDGLLIGKFINVPNVIIDWIIARNLINDKVKVRMYKQSEIEAMSDNEIRKLYRFLSKDDELIDVIEMKKSVLNTLKFLHKLQFDRSNLSNIPVDAFTRILMVSDTEQIKNLCNSSNDFKQKCLSSTARVVLIEKIRKMEDNMILDDFTNEDLIKYLQIIPYKKNVDLWANYRGGGKRDPLNQQYWFALGKERLYLERENINQIVINDIPGGLMITNMGKLQLIDLDTNELSVELKLLNKMTRYRESFEFPHRCWAIFSAAGGNYIVLTANGKYYYFDQDKFTGVLRNYKAVFELPANPELFQDYMSGHYRPPGY